MNQNNIYEMDYPLPKDTGDSFFWELTAKEKRLYKIFSEISDETIVGFSIRERLSGGSLRGFREMISELKDQMNDCGKSRMIEVIGIDAVKLLEVL